MFLCQLFNNFFYNEHDAYRYFVLAAFNGAVLGGDGVRVGAFRGLLAADAHAPVWRALAPAALPLQLRLHARGGRRRALRHN